VLNQLLKFTLVSSLLLWLRPRWKSLLALTAGVVLVHVFHGEYLDYVQLSGNDGFLVWSYVLKWTALLCVVGAYVAFLMLGARDKQEAGRAVGSQVAPKRKRDAKAAPVPSAASSGDDGFDFLRDKKHLDSRAEKIIQNKRG